MKITQKTLLVTGGATGIGLELSKLLVAQGNTVLICGRRQNKLDEAAAAIPGLRTYVCDVGDAEQCRQLVAAIKADGFSLDILVNNAAILDFDDFSQPDLDMDRIRDVVNANLLGPMQLTHLFLPQLLNKKDSMIVNVCSPAGRCAITIMPVYSATKAALDFFTRALRVQLQGKVKVVEVFPPTVATEMTDEVRATLGPKMTSQACAASLLKQLEQGKTNIWVGLEAKIFRVMDFLLHPLVFSIVNSPFGAKRK